MKWCNCTQTALLALVCGEVKLQRSLPLNNHRSDGRVLLKRAAALGSATPHPPDGPQRKPRL